MAGIAGCLALAGGTRPDADWVLRAVRRMAHRGPDDEHVISEGPVALAARRLAVIDPSAAGRQPMRSADGRYVIVYNGEIYNYVELAQRLRARGVALRGGSDTELLLETYAAEGKEVLRKLRGMFAFAIWDKNVRKLFCARDRLGKKPLYYYWDGRTFASGSVASGSSAKLIHQRLSPSRSELELEQEFEHAVARLTQRMTQSVLEAVAATVKNFTRTPVSPPMSALPDRGLPPFFWM